MSNEKNLTRQMWQLLEPVHAVLYYAPEAYEEAANLGYATGTRWPSYFAWRSAPLGAAGRHLVASVFYSFCPRMVSEYIPAAWSVASAEQVLAARRRAVDRSLRALFGDRIEGAEMAEAAHLAREAAQAADTAGRPLAAANADLPWLDAPHLRLWQAATQLREHRGDGHIAALQTTGLDSCESLVSFAAIGAAPAEVFASRGWSGQEWNGAQDRLVERGWANPDGTCTERGREGRAEIERRTDELAAAPWQALGAKAGRLAQLVVPLMQTIMKSGMLPRQSTLGINRTAPES